jgi:uncharacterized iron-regulated membrane protein
MMNWNGHMTTGGWVFSIVGMLIIVTLVGVAVVWLAGEMAHAGRNSTAAPSAPETPDRSLPDGKIGPVQPEQPREALGAPGNVAHEPQAARTVDTPG